MKTIYVKFKDLKAYHVYYWPRLDCLFSVEHKDEHRVYTLLGEYIAGIDTGCYLHEDDFVDLGEL